VATVEATLAQAEALIDDRLPEMRAAGAVPMAVGAAQVRRPDGGWEAP
jgi:hypothetical protein